MPQTGSRPGFWDATSGKDALSFVSVCMRFSNLGMC